MRLAHRLLVPCASTEAGAFRAVILNALTITRRILVHPHRHMTANAFNFAYMRRQAVTLINRAVADQLWSIIALMEMLWTLYASGSNAAGQKNDHTALFATGAFPGSHDSFCIDEKGQPAVFSAIHRQ
jgi:hypothetical protein